MTQPGLGLDLSTKRTRKREFLDEMRRVVPWLKLIALIEPHYPTGKNRSAAVPDCNDAADSLHATMVWSIRACYGRGTL